MPEVASGGVAGGAGEQLEQWLGGDFDQPAENESAVTRRQVKIPDPMAARIACPHPQRRRQTATLVAPAVDRNGLVELTKKPNSGCSEMVLKPSRDVQSRLPGDRHEVVSNNASFVVRRWPAGRLAYASSRGWPAMSSMNRAKSCANIASKWSGAAAGGGSPK